MTIPAYFMDAARVPEAVQPQTFGLWEIRRIRCEDDVLARFAGYPSITALHRWTNGTMHQHFGECVMEDSRHELSRHLPIWMNAIGRVLITGLGLGCVVRGLLAKPEIEHIDVIEIDPGIIAAIGPELAADPRVTIHCDDALEFDIGGRGWAYAWHDVWSDTDAGQPHLQCIHAKLIKKYFRAVEHQGAWAFPRDISRRLTVRLLGAPRIRRQAA